MDNEVASAEHPHQDDLDVYLLGRFPKSEIETLENHILHCPDCKDRIASIIKLKHLREQKAVLEQSIAWLERYVRMSGRAAAVAQADQPPTASGGFDLRGEPRFCPASAGFVRSFAPLLPGRWPVEVVDVSKNGLGLLAPTSLAKGTLIQVQVGETFALGEVQHSTRIDEQRFHIGIWITDFVGKR